MKIADHIEKISVGKFLITAFLAALVIRCGIFMVMGDFDDPEMYEHGAIARNLHLHGMFTMHWPYPSLSYDRLAEFQEPPPYEGAWIPPLNPYIIYIFFEVFGDNATGYFALMLLNAILGALAVFPTYRIADLLAGKKAAMASSVLAVLFLPAAYGVITFSGSQLYHLLALMNIYFAIKFIYHPKIRYIAYSAIFAGFQTLTRSEYLALSFVIIGVSLFISWKRNRDFSLIKALSFAYVIFMIIVSPWIIRNTLLFDKFVPIVSHPWHEVWRGNNYLASGGASDKEGEDIWLNYKFSPHIIPKLDRLPLDQHFEIAADSVFRSEAEAFIRVKPGKYLELAGKRMLFFWTIDPYDPRGHHPLYVFFVIIVIVPLFVSLIRLWKREKLLQNPLLVYLAFFAFYTLLIGLVNFETRYQVYLLTVSVPLTGIAVFKEYRKAP